ncbi:pseudouridine synthase [Salinicola rhizosphaerae]|uniref:Pseudouridine synthase n=1 Tax=Salinicola rhizosphaerae TaxID=1443141 RepID=A0ABQ3DN08_9GAMM|nr:pseudouridine synthase [Salinicola rhizosphaerae]GHB08721.1 ribosomal small subunit pseudouridine synthase A [Salinicola rhizosphaerae]
MRLDRYLSEATELTRSQAKRVLRLEEVTVNGEPVKDGARQVSDEDDIRWQEEPITRVGWRYLMMHKPVGVECSLRPTHYPSVMELIEIPQRERLHPVGRLDVETSGLLLITDDGQWTHRVTSPNRACLKRYRATLEAPLSDNVARRLKKRFEAGIVLQGEEQATRPATFERLADHEVVIGVTEGRYHQVRRMTAAVGLSIVTLHRESIGALSLDADLEPGECRFLTAEEIASF